MTSTIHEDGVRDFINDMEHDIIYVDKCGLEYLISFHDIDFEVTDAYYVNQGRHDTRNNIIKQLYDVRLTITKVRIQHRLLSSY